MRPRLPDKTVGIEGRPMKKVLTVSELNKYIKDLVSGDMILSGLWVRGEISNFKSHYSGHYYFTLKDEKAVLRCVMFRSYASAVPFLPENGMKVLIRGYISVYERDGQYQLYAEEIQPDGVGALYIAFEKLKNKLRAEGLFDESRKKKLPYMPDSIGVVTSSTGAVIRDIINVLTRRFYHVKIKLYPVQVQGEQAAGQIAAAVRRFNQLGNVDVIIVARGGGSLEELWAFNEEIVARSIYESKIPVISAVGHETDFTICDFAASARAATPTAAARLVIPDGVALRRDLARQRRRLHRGAAALVRHRRERLDNLAQRSFLARPLQILLQPRQNLDQTVYRFRSAFSRQLEQRRHALAGFAARLADLNPMAVLGRGFAVVRAEKGIIKTVRQLSPGQTVTLQFQDGEAEAIIQTLEGE